MDTREAQSGQGQTHANGSSEPVAEIQERTGPRKRVIFGVLGAIVAILLIIWGVKWFLYARVHEGTDDARVDADPVAVTSKINERIDQLLVNTNDRVTKGQLLVVLDYCGRTGSGPQRGSAVTARAGQPADDDAAGPRRRTASDRRHRECIRAGSGRASGCVASTSAAACRAGATPRCTSRVRSRKFRLQPSRLAREHGRRAASTTRRAARRPGASGGTASQRDRSDQRRAGQPRRIPAESRRSSRRCGCGARRRHDGARQTRAVGRSEPSRRRARAAIDCQQNLAYTRITSPINGFVGEKSAEVGQTVSPGLTIMTLIPDGPGQIYITANYKETQMGPMKVGQTVPISPSTRIRATRSTAPSARSTRPRRIPMRSCPRRTPPVTS